MSEELLIIYATVTGNAEDCAKNLAKAVKAAGLTPRLVNMYGNNPSVLKNAHTALFSVSTYGEGDPPDDGEDFWAEFQEFDEQLPNLRFAVFALGDTNYEDFCGFGRKIDERLETLGATRILPRADADVDFEEAYDTWQEAIVEALKEQAAAA